VANDKLNLIIRNAFILDGTGAAGWHGDIGVNGDRIVAVDTNLPLNAYIELDARGHAVSPGFIDAHTHDDHAIIAKPTHLSKLSQGVTTVVVGNCGISIAPVSLNKPPPAPMNILSQDAFFPSFAAYFKAIAASPPSVNIVAQCGHSALRVMAMRDYNRPAERSEIITMGKALIEAFEQGAAGFSTGLEYPIARESLAEEIVALCQITHEFGGFYTSHMRDEGENVLASIAETIDAGKRGRVPVVISHHKLAGIKMHGKSIETLNAIDDAAFSQIVRLDAYPYIASSTMLDAKRVKYASKTLIAWSQKHPELTGQEFEPFRLEHNLTIEEAVEKLSPAGGIYFNMDETDVRRILKHPFTMIGSDGLPHDTHPHPRLWGTFPKVLGHYARDEKLFTLEEAVHKMTGLTAETFGLTDRGIIREGAFADLVMFDQDTIADQATFDMPTKQATGIDAVWVNGTLSFSRGNATNSRAGRGLKRQDLRRLPWII
jgi:N-acyl-D-amino-acid deacylase